MLRRYIKIMTFPKKDLFFLNFWLNQVWEHVCHHTFISLISHNCSSKVSLWFSFRKRWVREMGRSTSGRKVLKVILPVSLWLESVLAQSSSYLFSQYKQYCQNDERSYVSVYRGGRAAACFFSCRMFGSYQGRCSEMCLYLYHWISLMADTPNVNIICNFLSSSATGVSADKKVWSRTSGYHCLVCGDVSAHGDEPAFMTGLKVYNLVCIISVLLVTVFLV